MILVRLAVGSVIVKDFNANWRLGRGEFREFRELVLIGVDFVSGRRVFVWGA